MYTRVTHYQIKSGSIAEAESRMGTIGARVSAIPGIVDCYSVWGADGAGVTFAVYESEAAAAAATGTIQDIWGSLGDILGGKQESRIYDTGRKLAG